MEARPNNDMDPMLPPHGVAATALALPGDAETCLSTLNFDAYVDEEAAHARCTP